MLCKYSVSYHYTPIVLQNFVIFNKGETVYLRLSMRSNDTHTTQV